MNDASINDEVAVQDATAASSTASPPCPGDAVDTSAPSCRQKRKTPSALNVMLAVVALMAIVVAVVGFSLYAGERAPQGAAAKVNDFYVEETDVADWINQYRIAYGYEDDADFASMLTSQNSSVTVFRANAVNQLAINQLVLDRADELGVTPSDEEVQSQVDAAKKSFTFNDDDIWGETLEDYGMSGEGVFAQYRVNLARQAVCEADVVRRDVTDADALDYIESRLLGTTQKHAKRIVFSGEDADSRAQECRETLADMSKKGTLDAEAFSKLAAELSDDEGAAENGGNYAWAGDASMSDEEAEALEELGIGSYSAVVVTSDGGSAVLFCDEEYTFSSDASDVSLEGIPDGLLELVRAGASDEAWQQDCTAYLNTLLASAEITYYPVPQDAAYNVDMELAASQGKTEGNDAR